MLQIIHDTRSHQATGFKMLKEVRVDYLGIAISRVWTMKRKPRFCANFHMNPARARLINVKKGESLLDYP